MQGAPALGFVHLDLTAGRRPGLLRGPFEFLPKLGQDRPLLLARGLELLGVGFESGLCLGDGVALSLCELGETRRQRLLHPVEIARPLG